MKITVNYISYLHNGLTIGYIWPWRRIEPWHKYMLFWNNLMFPFASVSAIEKFVENYRNDALEYIEGMQILQETVKIYSTTILQTERKREDAKQDHENFLSSTDITNLSC